MYCSFTFYCNAILKKREQKTSTDLKDALQKKKKKTSTDRTIHRTAFCSSNVLEKAKCDFAARSKVYETCEYINKVENMYNSPSWLYNGI